MRPTEAAPTGRPSASRINRDTPGKAADDQRISSTEVGSSGAVSLTMSAKVARSASPRSASRIRTVIGARSSRRQVRQSSAARS